MFEEMIIIKSLYKKDKDNWKVFEDVLIILLTHYNESSEIGSILDHSIVSVYNRLWTACTYKEPLEEWKYLVVEIEDAERKREDKE